MEKRPFLDPEAVSFGVILTGLYILCVNDGPVNCLFQVSFGYIVQNLGLEAIYRLFYEFQLVVDSQVAEELIVYVLLLYSPTY